jgi:glycosyltransferase involved in cell wall biosynthesis
LLVVKAFHHPLISIVIPVYNRASLITRALKSVQQQTYGNWEAVVVDDGSLDDTPQIVAALERDDERIRHIRQEKNRGAQAARNVGIRAATGEWIGFLDSDDSFLPNSLEIRLQALFRENLSVVHSAFNYVDRDGTIKPFCVPPIAGWVHRRLLAGTGPGFPALLVAKQALENIGYLDEKIVAFQEWETVIRLARHYRFGFVAEPTFLYDCRNSDSMSKSDLLGARGYEQVIRKHFKAILLSAGPGGLASHYQTSAMWYQRGGDRKAARRCILTAQMWSCVQDPKLVFRKLNKELHQLISRC